MQSTRRKRRMKDTKNAGKVVNNTKKTARTAKTTTIQSAVKSDSSQGIRCVSEVVHDLKAFISSSKTKKRTTEPMLELELEALIPQHSAFKNELIHGYITLREANIPYPENEPVYEALNKNPLAANKLEKIFQAFRKLGVPYQGDANICLAVIKEIAFLDDMLGAFKMFRKAKVPYSESPKLCLKIIENPSKLQKATIDAISSFAKEIPYSEVLFNGLVDHFENAPELVAGFQSLILENFSFEGNHSLYQVLINNSCHAQKLGEGIARLAQAGIFYKSNAFLYRALINNPYQADKLSRGFVTLVQGGLLLKKARALYKAFILDPYHSEEITHGFVALAQAGFSYDEFKALYDMLLNHKESAHDLAQAFILMTEAGISFKDNAMLYKALAKNARNADCLSKENLELLIKADIFPQENRDFYFSFFSNLCYAEIVSQFVQFLIDVNISYLGNKTLYHAIFHNFDASNRFFDILDLYKQFRIVYLRHPQHFNAQLLFGNNDIVYHFLTKLKIAGYSFEVHQRLFDALFTLAQEKANNQAVFNIIDKLCTYAKTNTLSLNGKLLSSQLKELKDIVCLYSEETLLAYGPLNKSGNTRRLEVLLEIIAYKSVSFSFEAPDTYLLHLPQQKSVNLSLLLRNANLSHLTLSDELIEALAAKFFDNVQKSIKKSIERKMKPENQNEVVNLLPRGLRMAVALYADTTHGFIDINRLFRSEKLIRHYTLHTDENKNILANFIAGCLLNDAANKLNVLPWQHPDVQELGIQKGLLDRRERLDKEFIQSRLANVYKFPALTSFSRLDDGLAKYDFIPDANVKTKLQVGHAFVVRDDLGEVIMPHGEQVLTRPGPGFFISTIVRSPSFEPKNHFWSEGALDEARQKHLLREYSDEKSAIMLSGETIVRPNHGGPHTYRVMLLLEYVAEYYAQHAIDPDFKAFCQSISDEQIEWLRVGAAFSVTGRESEINATIDLKRYESYREASAQNFLMFVNKSPKDKAMRERIHHVVRYMGNPYYERARNPVNNHENVKERFERNYYHRILTTAHKIDLARCYPKEDYKDALQYCRNLSLQSDEQKNVLHEIIRYDIALMKAHGNSLLCDLDYNGEFMDAWLYYDRQFARANLSLKSLFDLTETVSRPLINPKRSRAPRL